MWNNPQLCPMGFKLLKTKKLDIYLPDTTTELELPLMQGGISAGFPSPADDYVEERIDLNRELIKNPSATFFGRANGNSMEGVGIYDGDLLVVDRSREPRHNSILVCVIDGEFTVKRLEEKDGAHYLMPENKNYRPIRIDPGNDFRVWGVVTYSIHGH